MSKVSVWARFDVQPGKRDEVVAQLQEAFDAVAKEPGTLLYILHTDPKNDDVLYFYELYADQDALVAHGSGEWLKEFGVKMRPLLSARPDMQILAPVGGKGA
jgi:quinol monooxygenase YgiN